MASSPLHAYFPSEPLFSIGCRARLFPECWWSRRCCCVDCFSVHPRWSETEERCCYTARVLIVASSCKDKLPSSKANGKQKGPQTAFPDRPFKKDFPFNVNIAALNQEKVAELKVFVELFKKGPADPPYAEAQPSFL